VEATGFGIDPGTRQRLRGGRRGFFRTARLNAAGWAAVAGVGAAGAVAGLGAARLTDTSPWITVPVGGAAALAALVAADRRKWASMRTSYSWTDDLAAVADMAVLLQRAGIDASAGTDELGQPTLWYLNRHHRRVARMFRDRGLPFPPV
jgi:hypothetical protein